PRKHHHVEAHGGERGAPFHIALRGRLVGGEDAGALPARADARDRVLDRRLHFRVAALAEMAEARRQVGWPDEQPIDAVHARDRFQVVEPGARLDLHDEAELARRARRIVLDPAEARGPRAAGDASYALRWIAHRGYRGVRFLLG